MILCQATWLLQFEHLTVEFPKDGNQLRQVSLCACCVLCCFLCATAEVKTVLCSYMCAVGEEVGNQSINQSINQSRIHISITGGHP